MSEIIKLSRSTVEKYLSCPRCCVLDKKYKELKSSVCHGLVTRITLLKKSMIPMNLKDQNWVALLSGSR